MAKTDFFVVRSRDLLSGKDRYAIRRLPVVYTVGQICPKVEVPPPNSKEAKSFPARRLSAYIKRAFLKKGVAVKNADISRVFPQCVVFLFLFIPSFLFPPFPLLTPTHTPATAFL